MNDNKEHVHDRLDQLKSGATLVKRKSNGKKYPRQFYLNQYEDFISYRKSRRLFGKPRIYHIHDIDEIRSGFRAHTFDHLVKRRRIKSQDENRAFSIMYNNHRSEVHLLAPNEQIRDLWTTGIQNLIDKHSKKALHHLIQEESWILKYFRAADLDKSNLLSKQECRRLLTNFLHVQLPDKAFEQLFKKADTSEEGLLSPEEFIGFFHLLTRRKDLYTVMQQHTKHGHSRSIENIHMNINELLTFLQTVQNQSVIVNTDNNLHDTTEITCEYIERPEQVQKLIDEFELNSDLREQGLMSLDGFRNMLLSNDFAITNPIFTRQIYQDMTRPLCDYYINTSHNTYLFYSQLTGESNPEAYNRALLTGCRAVELDCYDGSDGQPIVTHGFTLVKPCSFESIIRYMEPNLFKTSPYPVILNIENHCSIEQQKEMARILKEILGDRLITEEIMGDNPATLPSPEELKYKVLVRSKKRSKSKKLSSSDHTLSNSDAADDLLSEAIQNKEMNLFVYLQNVPFRDHRYAKAHYSPLHSSSLDETRFEKISRENPSDLILQTTWRILRTYPGGLRQDSSNANPVDAWNYGIQMAALNYQNEDDIMPLCYGKFLDNGGCGYILKPDYLINAHKSNYSPLNSQSDPDYPLTLTLKIISAQFLTRSNSTITDIPDPYVIVSIHGVPCDQQIQKTGIIDNNGLDPIWNEKFVFKIKYPKMALIYFTINDYNPISVDDKLAHFCLPLTVMQTGYRHIHLRATNNNPMHSTLFVHVGIKNSHDKIISTRL
ncbi:hypothetical protein I4U23_029126 [Adineta vaga]|nr:hypothetical protein I4U23_029126 [Adineta vaga]